MPYSALPWPPGGSSSCTMALPSSMWRGVSPSPSSSCRTTSMHRLQTMFLICSVVVAICCNTGAKLTKISRDSMFLRLFLLPDHRSSSADKYPPLALAAGAFPRFPAAPRRAFRRCRLRFPYRTLPHPTAPCCTLLRPAAPRRTFRRCLSPFPAVPSRALCSFTRCELTSSLLPPTAFIRPGLAIFDEFRRKFT